MHLYKSGKNNHLLTQQKTSGVGRLLSPSHLDKKASVAKISASLLQNIKKKNRLTIPQKSRLVDR